jgi:plastocyanin
MQRTGVALLGSAAAVVLALGACGGDSDDEGSSDADVTVVAEDSLQFDEDGYTADAGEVAIAYEGSGSMTHTLLIEGVDGFKLTVSGSGGTDEGTVDLEPGDYVLYCDIPGHEDMRATLTVE